MFIPSRPCPFDHHVTLTYFKQVSFHIHSYLYIEIIFWFDLIWTRAFYIHSYLYIEIDFYEAMVINHMKEFFIRGELPLLARCW